MRAKRASLSFVQNPFINPLAVPFLFTVFSGIFRIIHHGGSALVLLARKIFRISSSPETRCALSLSLSFPTNLSRIVLVTLRRAIKRTVALSRARIESDDSVPFPAPPPPPPLPPPPPESTVGNKYFKGGSPFFRSVARNRGRKSRIRDRIRKRNFLTVNGGGGGGGDH